ncbi:MAG: EamA family transporter [Flavobacteriaceae bacterium]|jgi:drug/metabolite transporter (DMT)-like permease|nr:MAG: EamA family transporter [Bacteroidota bacterium]
MNITRLLAFLSIYLIWGSTYLLNKIAVGQLEPFMLAGVRFLSASFLMFLIVKVSSKSLKVTLVQLKNAAIAGFLFLAIGNGVVVWALSYVDSGLAALTIASQPLIVLLLLWIIENKRIKLFSWVGVFVGLLGMYLLISQNQITSSPESLKGIIMIIGCVITWGYASIFVGKAELPKNYLVNSAYQMFFGSLWLILMSMIKQEHWISPDEWEINVKWSMLGLIIFGSIVAFTSFNYLLRTVSPEKVATSTYINPIVAMVLGYLVLKETISTQSVVAAVVLLTGVYFINMKRDPRVYLRARAMKRLK